MKFFTDKTIINDYLLIKIKDYLKLKNFSQWKEIYIDPGVYDLTKSPKFSWEGKIDITNFLDSLPKNHYFSCDLPSDMNLRYKKLFLEKSWKYAQMYSYHPQFITTVQFYHNNYWSFKEWFDRYNDLKIKSGILGIGNYCKHHHYNEFIKHTLGYIFKNCRHPKIHIYGLAFRIIPIADKLANKNNIELSIDSTKWTRACNSELKWSEGYNCTSKNRQKFFDVYKKEIENRGVILENE